jgi:hypothetical protein
MKRHMKGKYVPACAMTAYGGSGVRPIAAHILNLALMNMNSKKGLIKRNGLRN